MDLCEAELTKPVSRHPWELARLRFVLNCFRQNLPAGNGRKILDVGCGDCFVLAHLAKAFPNDRFYGIDIELTELMKQQIGASLPSNVILLASRIEEIESDKPFDAIMMLDVLEHIPDDNLFLTELQQKSVLRPGGLLLMTVPAWPCLFSRHDLNLKHYRRYRRRTLKAQLQRYNLKIVRSSYFFTSLMFICLFSRILLQNRQQPGIQLWRGGHHFTRMLSRALYTDARVIYWLSRFHLHFPGLSCLMICRKGIGLPRRKE